MVDLSVKEMVDMMGNEMVSSTVDMTAWEKVGLRGMLKVN